MNERDEPRPEEIPDGWMLLTTGRAEIGDKYWRPADRVWLPLVGSDKKHGVDVSVKDMPIVIRKQR